MSDKPSIEKEKKRTIKRSVKAVKGTIKALVSLERDPPISVIACLEMQGKFHGLLRKPGNELLLIASGVNDYRRKYWQLQISISQAFISYLKARGYLPSFSPEVDSLKQSLPEAMIKGDDRVWKYSFDHYMGTISEKVGRSRQDAPSPEWVWEAVERKHNVRIDALFSMVNKFVPALMMLKSRLNYLSAHPGAEWDLIKVRTPKLERVERPLKKVLILKRPIPLPKKPKKPRKRLIGGLKREVIGPGGKK